MSSSGRRVRRSFSFSVRMTSSAPSEPTQPSKLPPFGTVSRWEPKARAGVGAPPGGGGGEFGGGFTRHFEPFSAQQAGEPLARPQVVGRKAKPRGAAAGEASEARQLIERLPEPPGVDELRRAT